MGEAFADYWQRQLGLQKPEDGVVYFAQGARFAASRERIRQRPKAFYESLLRLVSAEEDPCVNYFNEWAWHYIIGRPQHAPCSSSPASFSPERAARLLSGNVPSVSIPLGSHSVSVPLDADEPWDLHGTTAPAYAGELLPQQPVLDVQEAGIGVDASSAAASWHAAGDSDNPAEAPVHPAAPAASDAGADLGLLLGTTTTTVMAFADAAADAVAGLTFAATTMAAVSTLTATTTTCPSAMASVVAVVAADAAATTGGNGAAPAEINFGVAPVVSTAPAEVEYGTTPATVAAPAKEEAGGEPVVPVGPAEGPPLASSLKRAVASTTAAGQQDVDRRPWALIIFGACGALVVLAVVGLRRSADAGKERQGMRMVGEPGVEGKHASMQVPDPFRATFFDAVHGDEVMHLRADADDGSGSDMEEESRWWDDSSRNP